MSDALPLLFVAVTTIELLPETNETPLQEKDVEQEPLPPVAEFDQLTEVASLCVPPIVMGDEPVE